MPIEPQGPEMHPDWERDFMTLFLEARRGCRASLNELVELFRPYLLKLANDRLDRRIRAKLGASDIVQESLTAAAQEFPNFRGETLQEWLAWLRQILSNDLNQARRTFRQTEKRNVDREVVPTDSQSLRQLMMRMAAQDQTPSQQLVADEECSIAIRSIAKLSPDQERVVKLRHLSGHTIEEIAQVMGRSPDAIRKLWYRALLQLQREIERNER